MPSSFLFPTAVSRALPARGRASPIFSAGRKACVERTAIFAGVVLICSQEGGAFHVRGHMTGDKARDTSHAWIQSTWLLMSRVKGSAHVPRRLAEGLE